MSIVDKKGLEVREDDDVCQPFGIERPQIAGHLTVIEYVDGAGFTQTVKRNRFVAYFGRTAPNFPLNNTSEGNK
jgi:hypothetical protein